jgi:predicted dienelactone hydrolase
MLKNRGFKWSKKCSTSPALSRSLSSWSKPIFQTICRGKSLSYLGLGVVSVVLSAIPAFGAERIAFSYPPFGEFSLSIEALEVFAKEGRITKDFGFYAKRANSQQLAQLRVLLSRRLEVTPTLVSQFTYSPLGETLVRRLGEVLQTDSRQNGFYAVRSALILAAAEPEGLTVVNILRRFPTRTLRLNLRRSLQITTELSELLQKSNAVVAAIKQQAATEAEAQSQVNFSQKADLRQKGSFSWQQETLTLNDTNRNRTLTVDLYLPKLGEPGSDRQAVSLIVISHGAAEDSHTFAYLAQHLASYGFAIAVLEHPGINSQRFQQYFAGFAGAPDSMESIDQPRDVTFLLDELQRRSQSDSALRGRLNLQQVGVLGHSLGGYAVLALAGARINFEQLQKDCNPNNSLNLSLLVQCKSAVLPPANYALHDDRIKAAIAVHPLASSIFGQNGMSQIQVPLMLVAGSQDIFTPAVPEQIRPFTWLATPNKYLVLMENGTHFSTNGEAANDRRVFPVPTGMIGPAPAIARSYLKALSLAFFQTHLAHQPDYSSYLSASYAKFLSTAPLNLAFVQSLSAEQLAQVLNGLPVRSVTSSGAQPMPSVP